MLFFERTPERIHSFEAYVLFRALGSGTTREKRLSCTCGTDRVCHRKYGRELESRKPVRVWPVRPVWPEPILAIFTRYVSCS